MKVTDVVSEQCTFEYWELFALRNHGSDLPPLSCGHFPTQADAEEWSEGFLDEATLEIVHYIPKGAQ